MFLNFCLAFKPFFVRLVFIKNIRSICVKVAKLNEDRRNVPSNGFSNWAEHKIGKNSSIKAPRWWINSKFGFRFQLSRRIAACLITMTRTTRTPCSSIKGGTMCRKNSANRCQSVRRSGVTFGARYRDTSSLRRTNWRIKTINWSPTICWRTWTFWFRTQRP